MTYFYDLICSFGDAFVTAHIYGWSSLYCSIFLKCRWWWWEVIALCKISSNPPQGHYDWSVYWIVSYFSCIFLQCNDNIKTFDHLHLYNSGLGENNGTIGQIASFQCFLLFNGFEFDSKECVPKRKCHNRWVRYFGPPQCFECAHTTIRPCVD